MVLKSTKLKLPGFSKKTGELGGNIYFNQRQGKYLCIENFNEAKCHSELSEESQSPVKV